jgi:chromosomal replication initiation ATPase DnaA
MKAPTSDGMPEVVRDAPSNLGIADWAEVSPNLQTTLREAIKEKRWPIVLHGQTGTGKSCAAACIYRRWGRHCEESDSVTPIARWYRTESFVRHLLNGRMSGIGFVEYDRRGLCDSYPEHKIWLWAQNEQDLWCLDDFGTRSVSDAAFDVCFELINHRIGKPTIITTNLSLQQIAELYDDRIADRLRAGTIIELTGKSQRAGKRFKV